MMGKELFREQYIRTDIAWLKPTVFHSVLDFIYSRGHNYTLSEKLYSEQLVILGISFTRHYAVAPAHFLESFVTPDLRSFIATYKNLFGFQLEVQVYTPPVETEDQKEIVKQIPVRELTIQLEELVEDERFEEAIIIRDEITRRDGEERFK